MKHLSRSSLVLLLGFASVSGAIAQPTGPGDRSAAPIPAAATASSSATASGDVRVTARASKSDVTIGELFTVEIQGLGPGGTTWTFPADVPGEAVELRTPPPPADAKPGEVPVLPVGRMNYEAQAFSMENAEVPPVVVRYRLADGTEGELSTEAIPLRVLSVLPRDEEEPRIADIRPPVGVGPGREFWIALAIVLLGIAVAIWAFLRRKRPEAVAAPAAPPTPADVEARASLARLRASGLLARGEHRAYYIELTAVAKRYLERRLEAPVLEMTSAEMFAFVRDHPASSSHAGALRDVAGAADRIKFARGAGLIEEGERHAAEVERLVASVEAAFAPPPPPTGASPRGGRR